MPEYKQGKSWRNFSGESGKGCMRNACRFPRILHRSSASISDRAKVSVADFLAAFLWSAVLVDSAMAGAVGGYDALGTVRRNMQKISAEKMAVNFN